MADVQVGALVVALEGYGRRASDGARAAADVMALASEREIKTTLRTYTHSKGTLTPSPPGSPPALVSGGLRRSVKARRPRQTGAARWEAHTAPSIEYSRIQELGGWTGRGHLSYLPPRPYVGPSHIRLMASGELERQARAAFAAKVGLT
ncbi:hypothetical protein DQ384_38225 [Sphaerisporangium album]|uniref:HK97 gp10 family phage protein n=1 Tax=Sphaerisporangium album TaxID=509200 RepID=A0A367EMX9_9ACTN|nr:hypothetical protein [Sphaerisporangium album]RCG19119.1 hypothetical protein DQ384_38225 [Sphaerisporangium album]